MSDVLLGRIMFGSAAALALFIVFQFWRAGRSLKERDKLDDAERRLGGDPPDPFRDFHGGD